jgi:N-acetyl sugar amidotransferase
MERCTKCILPLSLPKVKVGNSTECSFCATYTGPIADADKKVWEKKEAQLKKILNNVKSKGKYDCIVPISGGKDSTFVLYYAVKVLKLRPLAFNYDNGFRSKEAVQNIERAVDKLGVDLIVYRPNQQFMLKLFKTFLQKAGEFCSPCNMLIGASMKQIAKQRGIKYILTGNVSRISTSLEGMSPVRYYDRVYYLNVVKGVFPYKEVKYAIEEPYLIKGIKRLFGQGQQNINVLNYLPVTREEIIETLEKELDWEQPEGELQHGDCLLDHLKDYVLHHKWGCSETTVLYSHFVRNGLVSRDEALKRIEVEERNTPGIYLNTFLARMNMSEEDFYKALKNNFWDVPNISQSRIFRLARKIFSST